MAPLCDVPREATRCGESACDRRGTCREACTARDGRGRGAPRSGEPGPARAEGVRCGKWGARAGTGEGAGGPVRDGCRVADRTAIGWMGYTAGVSLVRALVVVLLAVFAVARPANASPSSGPSTASSPTHLSARSETTGSALRCKPASALRRIALKNRNRVSGFAEGASTRHRAVQGREGTGESAYAYGENASEYIIARYYDPRQAQWTSPDPILASFMQGGPNGGVFQPRNLGLYTYAWNSPVRLMDPDGTVVDDPVGVAHIGAAASWVVRTFGEAVRDTINLFIGGREAGNKEEPGYQQQAINPNAVESVLRPATGAIVVGQLGATARGLASGAEAVAATAVGPGRFAATDVAFGLTAPGGSRSSPGPGHNRDRPVAAASRRPRRPRRRPTCRGCDSDRWSSARS